MEIEAERIRTKPKTDTINTAIVSANQNNNNMADSNPISEVIRRKLLDLSATVQAQQKQIQQQHQQFSSRVKDTRTDSSLRRTTHECYHCHQKVHVNRQCRSANDRDKQLIKDKLAKEWRETQSLIMAQHQLII